MKAARIVALVVLVFLAISATGGSLLLILHPDGSSMQMPVSELRHSPFHSFLIPGILLLLSNGLLGAIVFLMVLFRYRGYGWWVALQGCVLFGWITVEAILLREVIWLHFVYWALALLLIACGRALRTRASQELRSVN